MNSKGWMRLRSIEPHELDRVRGGVWLLVPAVQKIRQPASPLEASDFYLKIDDIKGDGIE